MLTLRALFAYFMSSTYGQKAYSMSHKLIVLICFTTLLCLWVVFCFFFGEDVIRACMFCQMEQKMSLKIEKLKNN